MELDKTLQPGEHVLVGFPPEVGALMKRYGARLALSHQPIVETSLGHYQRTVAILADGEEVGAILLQWESPPLPWYRRLWDRIHRRPLRGIEIELPSL